ncbi:hypothetical protein BDV37DRAFT_267159 [Aspergillus pseudonomiae]|uniref:Uncharacterized protein n=1 Tax=Aspergillus pseudonomiae TaxID=1506151 RepID=A0A5N7CT77_9EURO|nr:uncharacterized protein BDV37DRAFT_267159 [Aspergillus pseudonomiae]KAE8396887.1 hypothetical protein BDV37DRAFT_267159 [Aspergillus pseudonomiae]
MFSFSKRPLIMLTSTVPLLCPNLPTAIPQWYSDETFAFSMKYLSKSLLQSLNVLLNVAEITIWGSDLTSLPLGAVDSLFFSGFLLNEKQRSRNSFFVIGRMSIRL